MEEEFKEDPGDDLLLLEDIVEGAQISLIETKDTRRARMNLRAKTIALSVENLDSDG